MPNLNQILRETGQYPSITLKTVPLDGPQFVRAQYGIEVKTFLEYRFKASVVSPIADFSFTFAYPSQNYPSTRYIKEGDLAILSVNLPEQEYPLATGIIDTVEVQVTASGETITVMGRDMLGQWEDQGVYTVSGAGPAPVSVYTPLALYGFFAQNTRSQPNNLILQGLANNPQKFGVSPMDTKLQVVVRYLEPWNALVWCAPNGQIIWGKPNMQGPVKGIVMVSREQKTANCLSIRATRSAATVVQQIRPVLSGQELAASLAGSAPQLQVFPPLQNPMAEVRRLASLGHQLQRIFVSSDPSGGSPQSMSAVADLEINGGPVGRMNAYGLREMARENMRVLQVQAVIPGHVNEGGLPYLVDQCYQVIFDRADIDCMMYLYELEYTLDEATGPRTLLNFTYPNTIVAGNAYK